MKDDEKQYVLTYTGDVYKQVNDHLLKLSPWKQDEDRRVYEMDNDKYRIISYKNACMIVNKQFSEIKEEWYHNGQKYIADPIDSSIDTNKYASLISLLPSHKALVDSKELLKQLKDSSLSIDSNNMLTQLKLVKHNGKIFYILIVNQDLPRVRAFNIFGEFLQWCNIKHCKPIYNDTHKKFI